MDVDMPLMWILWITQKQGYPQTPQSLGQRKSSVDHIPTTTTTNFIYFKKQKKLRENVDISSSVYK